MSARELERVSQPADGAELREQARRANVGELLRRHSAVVFGTLDLEYLRQA